MLYDMQRIVKAAENHPYYAVIAVYWSITLLGCRVGPSFLWFIRLLVHPTVGPSFW